MDCGCCGDPVKTRVNDAVMVAVGDGTYAIRRVLAVTRGGYAVAQSPGYSHLCAIEPMPGAWPVVGTYVKRRNLFALLGHPEWDFVPDPVESTP
jgi:hypothetical protein